MTRPVVTSDTLDALPKTPERGLERFGARVASIGSALGFGGLGAMLVTPEPGKRAFPFHNDPSNDEMFIILEGEGFNRIGATEHPVKDADVGVAPEGGRNDVRQVLNTSDSRLKCIGISTSNGPDIAECPDSGKYAAMAIWRGASVLEAHLKVIGRADASLDCRDGEEV